MSTSTSKQANTFKIGNEKRKKNIIKLFDNVPYKTDPDSILAMNKIEALINEKHSKIGYSRNDCISLTNCTYYYLTKNLMKIN